jgi:integrase
MRMGALQSLDVEDFDHEHRSLELVHRPDEGPTLKNAEDGERIVALSEDVAEVIADYIGHKRNERTDDHGRRPLFSTKQGRISKNTIQQVAYGLTRPCEYGQACPHSKDPDDCEWTGYHGASSCPSSVSPHPIRRGSITWQLTSGPTRAVGDRCDVSNRVLEEHYDRRTEQEKMQQRREVLDI